MLITDELTNALKKLGNTCLLNVSRTVSDFLKESAADEELCAYIERYSADVSFQDELKILAKTRKFPLEPQRALPFIYAVLYVFDSNKLQPEDLISRIYPHTDIDEACTTFFTSMVTTLEYAYENAVSESDDPDRQTGDLYEKEDAFSSFVSFASGLPVDDVEEIIKKANETKDALSSDDPSLIKSHFYALESLLKNENVSLSVLDGIKDELMLKGVIV